MPGASPPTETKPKRKRREGPRTPSRGRGVVRFNTLLDATESLLQANDPGSVGLYQIADRAGVPPASVYHFFPTKEAAFVALAARYLGQLTAVHSAPIEARSIHGWQDLMRIDIRRAMEFYNRHPALLKILYGGFGGVEMRALDERSTLQLANALYERMNRIFHMPLLREPEKKFEIRIAILDAIWAVSVRRHGIVTEEYYEETCRACIAYIRLFLPEWLDVRQTLADAQAAGASIVLDFGDTPALDTGVD